MYVTYPALQHPADILLQSGIHSCQTLVHGSHCLLLDTTDRATQGRHNLILHLRLDQLVQFCVDGCREGLGHGADESVLPLFVQGLFLSKHLVQFLL